MNTAIFIRSDTIGHGGDELGANLMINFLHHLSEKKRVPTSIILMNSGVKLVTEDSDMLDSMRQLEEKGTTVLACGTCLNFFGIKEKQRVGSASTMPEITSTLLAADKVITI